MPRSPLRKRSAARGARTVRAIVDEIEWGARKLARARRASPQKSALATWSVLVGETPGAVWLHRNTRVSSPALVLKYRRAISEQAAGAPFQYAVGVAAFRALDLAVDRSVLIPRVETEGLVESVLAWARDRYGDAGWGLAADIGTGSGAIAIALALEGHFEKVIATDISPGALATARRNVAAADPGNVVELRLGSLLEPLRGLRCDAIVSNPPYLTRGECEQTAPEVRDFEPRLALNGGDDGLDLYRLLLSETAGHLRPGGLLALELDSRRAGAVHSMALAAGWPDARVLPDPFGRDRYLLATKPEGTT